MNTFTEKVLTIVRNIPKGMTISYAEVAARAGNPRAARAVGTIMRKNKAVSVPCHRVIKSDGSIGGYNRGGPSAKTALLKKERAL